MSEGIQHVLDLPHFFHGIVDRGNDGNTDPNGFMEGEKPTKVFKDPFIAHSRVLSVLFTVKEFYVIEKQVRVREDSLKSLKGNVSRSIHCRMKPVFLAEKQEPLQKINLQHALSAGEGHAASRGIIKGFILQENLKKRVKGVVLATESFCIVEAEKLSVLRICLSASSAPHTTVGINHPFGVIALPLGVVTPSAPKITALKKYRCANAGTVYVGVPVNVKNLGGYVTHRNSSR